VSIFQVSIHRLDHAKNLPLPIYATPGSAGADLCAAIKKDITIKPGERKLVPTGVCIALPNGFEAQIRPRSGLALKNGMTVLNAPGTVDSDYRGELKAILINLGTEKIIIQRGMRIAQLVVAPVIHVSWNEVSNFESSSGERSTEGFGSTGLYV
jgi:dUTP pyrophosphatase